MKRIFLVIGLLTALGACGGGSNDTPISTILQSNTDTQDTQDWWSSRGPACPQELFSRLSGTKQGLIVERSGNAMRAITSLCSWNVTMTIGEADRTRRSCQQDVTMTLTGTQQYVDDVEPNSCASGNYEFGLRVHPFGPEATSYDLDDDLELPVPATVNLYASVEYPEIDDSDMSIIYPWGEGSRDFFMIVNEDFSLQFRDVDGVLAE